jgi:hypothetical protein
MLEWFSFVSLFFLLVLTTAAACILSNRADAQQGIIKNMMLKNQKLFEDNKVLRASVELLEKKVKELK